MFEVIFDPYNYPFWIFIILIIAGAIAVISRPFSAYVKFVYPNAKFEAIGNPFITDSELNRIVENKNLVDFKDALNASKDYNLSGDNITPNTTLNATIILENSSSVVPEIPVSIDVLTGIDDNDNGLPLTYNLFQNYPNPFNPNTEIKLRLPKQSEVSLEIYNILGQRVAVLIEGFLSAGVHNFTWNASKAASGVYYYKLSAGEFTDIKKMLLLK